VSSSVETSYISRDDRFAAIANCYGDEATAPSFVRFTELLSLILSLFSFAGYEIISSPICPGCWTYQVMKKRNTSFQGGCVMLPV
jgi:hypothetical protein